VPLHWSNLPGFQLCVVIGQGTVTRADVEAYLGGTIRQGAKSYAKLVDLTSCTLALGHDDLKAVSEGLVRYGWGDRAGPVAMIVSTALNLDMAVLMKQRVGDRPFRIFTNIAAARAWLASYHESYHLIDSYDALSIGTMLRHLQLRAH
jgi:hypothetical protein